MGYPTHGRDDSLYDGFNLGEGMVQDINMVTIISFTMHGRDYELVRTDDLYTANMIENMIEGLEKGDFYMSFDGGYRLHSNVLKSVPFTFQQFTR